MALVKGTNCGFVPEAPTGDPDAINLVMDTVSIAMKDTSPAGATRITEIGWYCDNATEAADFEVGIYDHNAGDDNPEALVGKSAATAKGTGSGWKRVTGLNIAISAETIYWIAVQLDDTATRTDMDAAGDVGEKKDQVLNQTALEDPWGVSSSTEGHLCGFYAVWESAAAPAAGSAGSIREETLQGDNEHGLFN